MTPLASATPLSVVPEEVGRLLAVSVGLPRDVAWQGRTVHTGVWKRQVHGPQTVRTLNVEGDGQGDLGGHGGPHRAVLVYQVDSYRHWQDHFGRNDLEFGQFGENFTVDGLSDDDVCIGDRFSIGSAVFEVSQPRVTCYRVGLRLGEPRMPSLLVSHRRPGFYLRVLHEGVVEAGDPIVKVGAGPSPMTVAEVDALLYLPGHERSAVARALEMPALSPGWRGSFEAMLAAEEGAAGNPGLSEAPKSPPAWASFRPMRVVGAVRETATVVSIRLAAADGRPTPAALPGQFVALRLPIGPEGRALVRSYSLSGPPKVGEYRISVKREPHGVASEYIHRTLTIGALVEMAAPRGSFVLDEGDNPVVLVSAGIGATPLLSMLHALAQRGSTREVWWLHGARNSSEHPFAAEVRPLVQMLPNAHLQVGYSAPLPTDELGRTHTFRGRLSAGVLAALALPADANAYVCGPQSFMDEMVAALPRLGLDPTRIHSEAFGGGAALTPGIQAGPVRPSHPPAGARGTGPEVTFARSGLTVNWRADFASLLELAEACDVPARWSCRTGVCHNCESGLLAGSAVYEPDPIDLPNPGNVLICCARPREDVVLDL